MPSLNVRLRNRLRWIYVLTDFGTTNLAIFCFNVFRWSFKAETISSVWVYYHIPSVWMGQIVFPLLLMFIYWLSGYYNHVENRSRAQEAITTLTSVSIGAFVLFFLAVINDFSWRRRMAFENIFVAMGILFLFVYLGRYLITRIEVKRIHNRHHITDAVVLGTDAKAVALANRINSLPKGTGMRVSALVRLRPDDVPAAGSGEFEIVELDNLTNLIESRAMGSLILSPSEPLSGSLFTRLMALAVGMDVQLLMSPEMETIALASNRSFDVLGEPLVCISHPNISDSTVNIKRCVDVVGSIVALIVASPLFLLIAAAIKLDSIGPVFFSQVRLGRGGREFRILKFRSMTVNAENGGEPRLTVDNDPRITRMGRLLRKYRLDELPQFINVIRGDMSLVGPRPEREAFARRIAARVPAYPLIYQVRPGITSWGMVRYGYASSIDQMVERLRYDMLYLETISISTDIKILLHTVNTVISGRGK